MKNVITLKDGTTIYGSQVARFTSYAIALRFADKSRHFVEPILGDDGRFWVAATLKIQGQLVKEGYELAGA